MYKNKGRDGSHNLCGTKVKYYRKRLPGHPSQNAFAKMAQLEGLDIDKNVIQRVVSGQRFVTDIDMKLCSMMNKGRLWPSFFVLRWGRVNIHRLPSSRVWKRKATGPWKHHKKGILFMDLWGNLPGFCLFSIEFRPEFVGAPYGFL